MSGQFCTLAMFSLKSWELDGHPMKALLVFTAPINWEWEIIGVFFEHPGADGSTEVDGSEPDGQPSPRYDQWGYNQRYDHWWRRW